jgi:hypothetical protein
MNVLEFMDKIEKLKRRINAIESVTNHTGRIPDEKMEAQVILKEIQSEYKKQLEEYEDILRKTPVTIMRGEL